MARATKSGDERGAERGASGQRNGKGDPDANGEDSRPGVGSRNGRLGGARAAALARQQLEELITRPVEAVSGLARRQDGWAVMLEVVELERVPPTTDILATYRVVLDEHGELMGYERVTRYYRNQAGGDS